MVGVYSSTLTIEELVDDGATGRLVLLSGAGLPIQGAAWGGEHGLVTTWYPGNRRATQQVLGPHEVPSQWTGEWHRTTLPDSGCLFIDENGSVTKVTTPFFLCQQLEDILRSGHLLRVTWSVQGSDPGETGNIVREGRAKSWSFPYERLQDIHWDITFDWVGRDEGSPNVSTRDEGFTSATNELSAAVAQALLKAKALGINVQAPKSLTLGQLDALANYPNQLVKGIARSMQRIVNQFAQVGDIVGKLKSLPFSMANTAVDFAHNNIALSKQFVDQITRTPPELLTLKSKASEVSRAASSFYQVDDAVELAARLSAEFAAKFTATAAQARQMSALSTKQRAADENDIIAIHVTKQGDTPEKVSMKYYKTADRALDILRANKLPFHQPSFKPGIALIIPRLNTSQSAA